MGLGRFQPVIYSATAKPLSAVKSEIGVASKSDTWLSTERQEYLAPGLVLILLIALAKPVYDGLSGRKED